MTFSPFFGMGGSENTKYTGIIRYFSNRARKNRVLPVDDNTRIRMEVLLQTSGRV
jgi:hypothetical protein